MPKTKIKNNLAIPGEPMSQTEFVDLIKEAENGVFTSLGSFDDFKKDILSVWKKRHVK